MRVAVVTPYFQEDINMLRICNESVRAQRSPCTHFMIADGHPKSEINSWTDQHIVLPQSHGVGGDLPRGIGSVSAIKQAFDAITYLDADNWYSPDHIEKMIDLQRSTSAQVCIARRSMHRLDGSPLARTEPFSQTPFFDTNCMFLTRPTFSAALIWAVIPTALSIIGDRVVSLALHQHQFRIARHADPTVHYRTSWAEDYIRANEIPPVGAKSSLAIGSGVKYWQGLSEEERQAILGFPASQSVRSSA